MKYFIIVLMAIALSGCGDGRTIDQCKRAQLFKQCMDTIPKDNIDMSDWNSYDINRIIDKCSSTARHMSLRNEKNIKMGCK